MFLAILSVHTSQGAQKNTALWPKGRELLLQLSQLNSLYYWTVKLANLQSTVPWVCLFHQSSKVVNHKATQGGHATHFRWFTEQKYLNYRQICNHTIWCYKLFCYKLESISSKTFSFDIFLLGLRRWGQTDAWFKNLYSNSWWK